MKASQLHVAVFKSRIGKRIFSMFVGCSIVPIVILAVLSYLHVEQQLKDQTAARLRQTSKAIGMSIYERLEFLEAHLFHSVPKDVRPDSRHTRHTSWNGPQRRFNGVLFQNADDGRHITLQGRVTHPPDFTAAEMRELRSGRTHIGISQRENQPARIHMSLWAVLPNHPPGIVIGEINPAYLWGIGEHYGLPPSTELAVMDHRGRVLISSLLASPEGILAALRPARDTSSRQLVWQDGDRVYLASYWDLFLKSRFAADTWTIVLSQTREDALAAIHRFKFDFPLVLLVGFWIVLLVSIRFIRKSVEPLETLRNATRRIQHGDFSQPVVIRSGNEFEDLAASFNTMITRLARTFDKLEASEARFREAFDHAATGIALVTVDFRIAVSNRYLQHLLGYSEAELATKCLQDLSLEEDKTIGEEALDRLLSGDLPFTQYEKRYRHKNGEPVWVRTHASLMRDASDRPQQFIFHIRDLTAEKNAENDKRRLENQLRQAQKMEAMGTLAGGIAHDFNNILSAVGGYTELALMQLPPDAEFRGNLEQVKKAADRAANLVRQILTFSRQAEHEKIPCQISSVVKEALQLLRASMPATIEIRKTIVTDTAPVFADPTQIHQIVMNLCTNAMHAMEDGGVLKVSLEQLPSSSIAVHDPGRLRADEYLRLTVADSGCGMDAHTRERIFDPYFTTKTKDRGTGLGLSVVHGIVVSHQGFIEVSSTLGEGTRFDVYFPIAEVRPDTALKPTEDPRHGNERVLFIDDEPMLVEIGKTMLGKQGYQVIGMTDPYQALEAFRSAPDQYDIVITDLTMPGITGDRLAEQLAAVRPDIPILLCSGYMQSTEIPFLAGFIHKPVQMQELRRAVRDAIDRKGAAAAST